MKTGMMVRKDLSNIKDNLPQDVLSVSCDIVDGGFKISGGNNAILDHVQGSTAENSPHLFMVDAYIKTIINGIAVRLVALGVGKDDGFITYNVEVKKHNGRGPSMTNEYALTREEAIAKFITAARIVKTLT